MNCKLIISELTSFVCDQKQKANFGYMLSLADKFKIELDSDFKEHVRNQMEDFLKVNDSNFRGIMRNNYLVKDREVLVSLVQKLARYLKLNIKIAFLEEESYLCGEDEDDYVLITFVFRDERLVDLYRKLKPKKPSVPTTSKPKESHKRKHEKDDKEKYAKKAKNIPSFRILILPAQMKQL